MRRKGLTVIEIVIGIFIITAVLCATALCVAGTFSLLREPVQDYKARNVKYYRLVGNPLPVSVDELMHAYEASPEAGKTLYAGRYLIITGVFRELKHVDGEFYFYVGPTKEWSSYSLKCLVDDPNIRGLAKLGRGDKIEVCGLLQHADTFSDLILHKPNIYLKDSANVSAQN